MDNKFTLSSMTVLSTCCAVLLFSGCAILKLPGQIVETVGKAVEATGKVVVATGQAVGKVAEAGGKTAVAGGKVAEKALETPEAKEVIMKQVAP